MTRRTLLKILAAAPAAPLFPAFGALAAPSAGKLKITAIKALGMQPATAAGNCLIRVETDGGLYGIGEAGSTGPMARARIQTMERLLIGKDPLSIEKHFFEMTSLMHTYIAHIPTISGIDMALWDLAGKVLDRPVYELLGGPFREAVMMYSHGDGFDMLDMGACRAWAAMVKSRPEGFKAYKNSINTVLGVPAARYANTLTHDDLKKIRTAYTNCREAVGDEIDIAVHCHNEFDTPSAIAVAKAVEPMDPLFIEDALNPPYSEGLDGAEALDAHSAADRRKAGAGAWLQAVSRHSGGGLRASGFGVRGRIHRHAQDRRLRRADADAGGAAQCRHAGADARIGALRGVDPELLSQ
jgi:L-alanine-DL-glutamate epimerase-like enolase superfamily enzyme